VSSHGIFLQLEPSVSMMVLLFHGLWKIWVKESHDKKYFFFVTLDLKSLSQAQFKRKLVTINTNVPCLRYFYKTFLKKWRNKIIWGVLWGKNWFWQRLLAKPTLRRKKLKKKYFWNTLLSAPRDPLLRPPMTSQEPVTSNISQKLNFERKEKKSRGPPVHF